MYPLLDNEKTSELTDEDIMNKITELQKKIGAVYSLAGRGSTEMLSQLNLLLNHYEMIMQERMFYQMHELMEKDPKLGRTVIDIDWPDPKEDSDE